MVQHCCELMVKKENVAFSASPYLAHIVFIVNIAMAYIAIIVKLR